MDAKYPFYVLWTRELFELGSLADQEKVDGPKMSIKTKIAVCGVL